MVRTTAPLVERMTLIWHSWFATSNQGVASQKLMLDQNQLFRQNALGSFADLLVGVTQDPAMLVWLNGNQNVKSHPNENYGREMMELFTLGANRGAYTETDVREQARALTGWRGSVNKGVITPFTYDVRQHDTGHEDDLRPERRLRLARLVQPLPEPQAALRRSSSRSSGATSCPSAYDAATLAGLQALYAERQILPVVEAILKHPAFYTGPRMLKSPVVFNAGLLRMRGRGIDTSTWWSLGQSAGQQLFYPPDVGGWDYTRWLDTATFRARWFIAALVQGAGQPTDSPSDPAKLVQRSIQFWGFPTITPETRDLVTSVREGAARAQEPRPGRRDRRPAADRLLSRPADRR